jgi:hypothetical protein
VDEPRAAARESRRVRAAFKSILSNCKTIHFPGAYGHCRALPLDCELPSLPTDALTREHSMTNEQHERASAERHILLVEPMIDDHGLSENGGEPSLAELLDDPIMALLWRADGLEPRTARATVMGLQKLVKCTRDRRLGQIVVECVAKRRRSLAA